MRILNLLHSGFVCLPHLDILAILELVKQDLRSRLKQVHELVLICILELASPLQKREHIVKLAPYKVLFQHEFPK